MKFDYNSKAFPDVSFYTKHEKNDIPIMLDLIRLHDPVVFIELGTFKGGFTAILHEEFPTLRIFSFDKYDQKAGLSWKAFKFDLVTFFIGDIFAQEPSRVEVILNYYRGKRKVLYCDNGDKEKEVRLYAKYLSPGDLLGVHDWEGEVNPVVVDPYLQDFDPFSWETCEGKISARFWKKL